MHVQQTAQNVQKMVSRPDGPRLFVTFTIFMLQNDTQQGRKEFENIACIHCHFSKFSLIQRLPNSNFERYIPVFPIAQPVVGHMVF